MHLTPDRVSEEAHTVGYSHVKYFDTPVSKIFT